jgi:hypothetical protein
VKEVAAPEGTATTEAARLHTQHSVSAPNTGGGQRHIQPCTKLLAQFERVGQDYDDFIVAFAYDWRAVDAIKALPWWARRWDPDCGVWRVHPDGAVEVAARLHQLGYQVVGLDHRSAA